MNKSYEFQARAVPPSPAYWTRTPGLGLVSANFESPDRRLFPVNKNMTQIEAAKLQMFLNAKLNPELVVQCRNRPDECAEIHIGDECLGVVSKIIDEGETSYSFEITILDIDLEDL